MRHVVVTVIAGIAGFAALVLDRVPLFHQLIVGGPAVTERAMKTRAEGIWVIEANDRVAIVTMRQGETAILYREQGGYVRAASACDDRSFVRAAHACRPENRLPLSVTRLGGDLEVGPDALYVIHSEYLRPGRFQFAGGELVPTRLVRLAAL